MQKFQNIFILAILFFSLIGFKSAHAQFYEYEIKAAYIFNFAKFIEWDEKIAPADTLVLGIYKNDPFGIILEKTMVGRKANGRDWKIIRIEAISQMEKCNILFFSDITKYDYLQIIDKLKDKSILTIGDELSDFCENGGMVNFTKQHSKNQFEINNEIAVSKGIIFNPKLLLLAKIVPGNEDEF